MLILIVFSYDPDKSSTINARNEVQKIFQTLYEEAGESNVCFSIRDFDQLGDLVVDWEHEPLHHTAEAHCEKFDQIDMIIIVGDLSVLPWDPRATQLVSLVNMAKFSGKPLIGLGFGAFMSIYSIATKGNRFFILNGPTGETVDQLPHFPRYSIGKGAFPGAWLDRETGDLYIYQANLGAWQPICNIGMHAVSPNGTESALLLDDEHETPKYRHQQYQDRLETIAPSEAHTITKKTDACVLHIAARYWQHPLLQHTSHTNSNNNSNSANNSSSHNTVFHAKIFHGWRLNRKGALPPKESLLIVGEGNCGPLLVLTQSQRMLLFALRYESSEELQNTHILKILHNFVSHRVTECRATLTGKIDKSLRDFLFGIHRHASVQGQYDSALDRHHLAPPLCHQLIPSTLSDFGGPTRVDAPLLEMFYRSPKTAEDFDFTVLTNKRRNSSVGRRPRMHIQQPMHARRKRLEKALQAVGYGETAKQLMIGSMVYQTLTSTTTGGGSVANNNNTGGVSSIFEGGSGSEDQQSHNHHSPAREMLAGLIMNETSITSRRQHNVEYQRFLESQFPNQVHHQHQQYAAATRRVSDLNNTNQQQQHRLESSSFLTAAANNIDPETTEDNLRALSRDGIVLDEHKQKIALEAELRRFYDGKPVSRTGTGTENGIRATSNLSSTPQQYHHTVTFDSHLVTSSAAHHHRKHSESKPSSAAAAVPLISDWVKVFQIHTPIENDHKLFPSTANSHDKVSRSHSPLTSARPAVDDILSPTQYNYNHRHLITPTKPTNDTKPLSHRSAAASNHLHHRTVTHKSSAETQSALTTHSQDHNQDHHDQLSYTVHSPRSAEQILNTKVQCFIPVQHPIQTMKKHSPRTPAITSSNSQTSSVISSETSHEGWPYSYQRRSTAKISSTQQFSTQHRQLHHTGDNSDSSEDETMNNDDPAFTNRVKMLTAQSDLPRSNYKKLKKQLDKNDKQQKESYEGYYTLPFLTPEERYRNEENQSKAKFIAGNFKLTFSSTDSALKLRPEGLVRPCGPYPDPPGFSLPEGMTATDWIYAKDLHIPAEKLLAGQWKS
jgi:hypothetical protein